MGFNIFAWGYRGHAAGQQIGRPPFQYSKNDCLTEGDFEPSELLKVLPTSQYAANTAKRVVGDPESQIGGATVKGMLEVGKMQFAELISQFVTLLGVGKKGEIAVYCYQDNTIWYNTNSFETFYFGATGNPGKEFLKKISPGLVKTELNDFGVLRELVLVLGGYYFEKPKGAKTMLRIEIKH